MTSVPVQPEVAPPAAHAMVTVVFATLCLWLQVWLLTLGEAALPRVLYTAGLIPAVITRHAELPAVLALLAPPWTFVSSLFVHASWTVLALNLLGLWLFGGAIETALGRARCIAFYLVCGIFGDLAQVVSQPYATVPTVGAGAAVAGAAAARLLLTPQRRLLLLSGGWLLAQISVSLMAGPTQPGIGWAATLGGGVTGCSLLLFFKRREVSLLAR